MTGAYPLNNQAKRSQAAELDITVVQLPGDSDHGRTPARVVVRTE